MAGVNLTQASAKCSSFVNENRTVLTQKAGEYCRTKRRGSIGPSSLKVETLVKAACEMLSSISENVEDKR